MTITIIHQLVANFDNSFDIFIIYVNNVISIILSQLWKSLFLCNICLNMYSKKKTFEIEQNVCAHVTIIHSTMQTALLCYVGYPIYIIYACFVQIKYIIVVVQGVFPTYLYMSIQY